MKKLKKCYRTITADNYDPMNCIGEQCSAWMKTSEVSGCSFVLKAVMSTIAIITDLTEQEKEKEEQEREKNAEHNNCESEPQGGEGRSAGVEEDRPQDDPSRTIQKDTKEATPGEDQGYVGKGEDQGPLSNAKDNGIPSPNFHTDDPKPDRSDEANTGNTKGGPEPSDQGVSGDTLDYSSCASVTANPIVKEP